MRPLFPLLVLLFFFSGASSLIYQVLWLRLLGLVFGVTVYAASTVWAAFMGGLALGSLLGGRAADRVRRPLVWFGIVELLIAATALMSPLALDRLQGAYAAIHPALDPSMATLTVVRFAISSAVLIVPAALMGATLPLVVKSSLLETEGLGGKAGLLYGANTAGAILGTLAAGLLLVPALGIQLSFAAAASVNVTVALAAMAAARLVPARQVQPRRTASPHSRALSGNPRQVLVLLIFGLSGFVSLALEVVWFRVTTLFLRPTVYGYAMMLAAVLAGIAIGSCAAAPILRRRPRRDWLTTLGWLQGGIAIAALLSVAVLPLIPGIMEVAGPIAGRLAGDYLAYQAVVSAVVIMPAMLLFGAAFPIGLQVWASRTPENGGAEASRIGIFYALNVSGAIVGSLAAGFLLLPRLGSLQTIMLLGSISLASALLLLAAARSAAPVRLLAALTLAVAFAATWRATPDPFDAFLAQRYPGQSIVWRREAVQATVSVHREPSGLLTLHVNGNHQASSVGATHHRIGTLPMAVHPDARSALVIGLGGGATAGAVSQHADVAVDVVELSREVAQAADRFFRDVNFGVLRKPNVRTIVDDGRNFLLLTTRRYDVVTADVILPIHAGSGNLYSREYFTLVRRALRPGGLVMQWVAGTEAEYK